MPDGLDFSTLPRWCVFTETDVVRRGLDAAGWTKDVDLSSARLLEPAAGDGAFVVEAAIRLIGSFRERGIEISHKTLGDRIVAFEIEPSIIPVLRANVSTALSGMCIAAELAKCLAQNWCREGDFLVAKLGHLFTSAVGNPPFRRNGGAAPDTCVSFIERSFLQLADGGRMAMLAPVALGSATGARAMRAVISREGRLESVESYEPSTAFVRRVAVRGALFVAVRGGGGGPRSTDATGMWLAGSDEARRAYHDAQDNLVTLEQAGCRIRLGMATGKNSVFVRNAADFDIEEDVLVPAVSTRDLTRLGIVWKGQSVIDTARPDGQPWTADEKPRLSAYLEKHRLCLQDRHSVASGASWRQTHTRLDRGLAARGKVLVAETASPCRVALNTGGHMPLNSVHAVTSIEWPLRALAAFLEAGAVGLVANALLLRRGGGHLRVNATALRQVRIPRWHDLSMSHKEKLSSGDPSQACEAVARILTMSDNLLRQCTGFDKE